MHSRAMNVNKSRAGWETHILWDFFVVCRCLLTDTLSFALRVDAKAAAATVHVVALTVVVY